MPTQDKFKIFLGILLFLAVVFLLVIFGKAAPVSFELSWTAPGDDGDTGVAAAYDMRYATDSLSLVTSWPACDSVRALPAPDSAGRCQSVMINLPENHIYYFAIKTVDEAGNWSEMSNIARIVTPDITVPARIRNLILGGCR